jgi:sugar lactone lactonase YvrE
MKVPDCVLRLEATLGEGPLWLASEQAVWFVDIKQHLIHRYEVQSKAHRSWVAPTQPSFLAPYRDGFVVGTQGALHRFNPKSGSFSKLIAVESDQPGNRLNDGFVDALGRLWFGSMDDAEETLSGALYCMGRDLTPRAMDRGYCITNGPTMSPDGRIFYHTDTIQRTIFAFDVEADGELQNKRILVRLDDRNVGQPKGYFDGSITDSEGCLWTGMFGGSSLVRYSPRGEVLDRIELPCANVTKAAFGDTDLRTLYITTARKGLSPTELQSQPLAGSLFAVRVVTPGLPQHMLAID